MKGEQLLTDMLELSRRLRDLDFHNDENLAELERIQNRQTEIQHLFDLMYSEKKNQLTPEMKVIASEISQLEQINLKRMQDYLSELEQTGREIRSARLVRNLYENNYTQEFGYFIDSHK